MNFWMEEKKAAEIRKVNQNNADIVENWYKKMFYSNDIIDGNFTYTKERGEACAVKKIYRKEQDSYSKDIVYAIITNKILLIEGGVGLGKSWGYLIPIFSSFIASKDSEVVRFNKVVISTSNIALQNQLIRDIDIISKELNFAVEAVIAKGVNNYACIKRIESAINSNFTFDDRKDELKRILKQIEKIGSCDKIDLEDVSRNVWDSIKLRGRGYCSKCTYVKRCPFYQLKKKISSSNIIITNHANYISNVIKSTNNDRDEVLFTDNIDMLVMDEAHQIEANLINVLEEELKLNNIFFILDKVRDYVISNVKDDINVDDYDNYIDKVKENFKYLFAYIKRSASIIFSKNNKNNTSITDGEKLSFNMNKGIVTLTNKIFKDLLYLLKKIELIESLTPKQQRRKEKIITVLKLLIDFLEDMLLGNDSKNIYWVSFFNEDIIKLGYVVKDKSDVIRMMYNKKAFNSDKKIPVILTSATMGENGNYEYFRQTNGLNDLGRPIDEAEVYASPYDYDNNALFYYDKDVAPLTDKDNNIKDLALKISELVRITNGKALVLFTSKTKMREVYDLVTTQEFPFKILMQDEFNANAVKVEFENDVDSCLFSTSFWEGISVKGSALSNVIITQLPFDTVDAINKFEASKYSNNREKMKNVYIPKMLLKLEQGIGRLIRTDTDTGVICCLDSRIVKYLSDIRNVSPIKNFTDDIKMLTGFSDEKINGSEVEVKGRILS